MIKATEGPYRDGEKYVPTGFKEFYRRAEAEGFVMGAYHFLLSTPAKAQADHFLRTIDAVGGPEDKILMVDFEHHPNPALTPGNDQLEGFIAEVKRRVGDHPLVVYSARNFWNGGDSSGDFDRYGADVAWDAYYLHMDPVRPRQFYANSEQDFMDAGIPWGERAVVKQPRTLETGAYRPGSMDGKELPVGNGQGQQGTGEGAQQKPPYGFFLVLAAIVVVAIM